MKKYSERGIANHLSFIGGKRARIQEKRVDNEEVLQEKIDKQKKQLQEEEEQLRRQKDRRREQSISHVVQLLSNTEIAQPKQLLAKRFFKDRRAKVQNILLGDTPRITPDQLFKASKVGKIFGKENDDMAQKESKHFIQLLPQAQQFPLVVPKRPPLQQVQQKVQQQQQVQQVQKQVQQKQQVQQCNSGLEQQVSLADILEYKKYLQLRERFKEPEEEEMSCMSDLRGKQRNKRVQKG